MTVFPRALRTVPKRYEGRPVYAWLWQRDIGNQAHILVVFCYSQGTGILVNGFSALLSMRRCKKNWVHKIFCWKCLSRGRFCQFFQSTECLILIFTWNSFQNILWVSDCSGLWLNLLNWTVNNIILQPISFGLNFYQGLGDICPMVLGMFIPRLGEEFVDRLLTMLFITELTRFC